MGYWIDDTSDRDRTSRRCLDFLMDSSQDLNSLPKIGIPGVPQPGDSSAHLPVEKGSTAFSVSEFKIWFLNSQNQWVTKI